MVFGPWDQWPGSRSSERIRPLDLGDLAQTEVSLRPEQAHLPCLPATF